MSVRSLIANVEAIRQGVDELRHRGISQESAVVKVCVVHGMRSGLG